MASSYSAPAAPRSPLLGFLLSLLVLLVAAAAQSTWPQWLRLCGQVPDLTLAAVLSIGLTTGAPSGLTAGFLGAYLWAAVAGLPMGNLFVSHMSLGFVAGAMRGRMFSDRLLLAMIVVAAGVMVAGVINLVLAPPPTLGNWISAAFTRALFSGLLAMPVYGLMRWLSRYYPKPEDL